MGNRLTWRSYLFGTWEKEKSPVEGYKKGWAGGSSPTLWYRVHVTARLGKKKRDGSKRKKKTLSMLKERLRRRDKGFFSSQAQSKKEEWESLTRRAAVSEKASRFDKVGTEKQKFTNRDSGGWRDGSKGDVRLVPFRAVEGI